MKKFLLLLVLVSTPIFAQESSEKETDFKKNELHLNVLMPVALKSFELEYERCIGDQSGVGASIFIGNSDVWEMSFEFTPYFRKYFGKEQAKGFFLEGFTMINSVSYQKYHYEYAYPNYYTTKEEETNVAFGIGLGGKFISNDNFIGIINAGIGRNLFSDEIDVIPRFGIHFGYRF